MGEMPVNEIVAMWAGIVLAELVVGGVLVASIVRYEIEFRNKHGEWSWTK